MEWCSDVRKIDFLEKLVAPWVGAERVIWSGGDGEFTAGALGALAALASLSLQMLLPAHSPPHS